MRHGFGNLQHRRHTGRVVVSTEVNIAGFVIFRQRIGTGAGSQMVDVRTDDNNFMRWIVADLQSSQYVASGFLFLLDVDVGRDLQTFDREAHRRVTCVQLLLNFLQILAAGLKPLGGDFISNAQYCQACSGQ